MSALSELRNALVHDVRQVSFRFEDYLASLDSNQKRQFVSAMAYFSLDLEEDVARRWQDNALTHTKLTIAFATLNLLVQVYFFPEERKSGAASRR